MARKFILLQGMAPDGVPHTVLVDKEHYEDDKAPARDYFLHDYTECRELGVITCNGCTDEMDAVYGSD